LPNVLLFLRRKGFQRLVLLARGLPLGRRKLGPRAHLLPDAMLLLGRHLRITLRDPAPFLLARGVEFFPVGRERREDLSFRGREDRTLKDTLLAEREGILAWMVRGCLEWQKAGLAPPKAVTSCSK
jgi:hypothetical protein